MIFNFKQKNLIKKFFENDKVFDIQIIGAGIAGISLAYFLIKINPYLRILLIERGDFISKAEAKKQMNGVKFNGLEIKNDSRVFGVGGSSITWGNIISNITKDEVSNKWPLEFNELRSFCDRAAKILNLDNSSIDNLKPYERKFNYSFNPINFQKFLDTSKVDLLYNCKVEKIFERQNVNFSKINFKKKNFFIKSKKTILCSGTLEIIRLLFNSSKDKKSLRVNKNVLGKYFMNHPKLTIGEIKYIDKNINIRKYLLKKNGEKLSYIGISLPNNKKKKLKLLNSYVKFKPKIYSLLENRIDKTPKLFEKIKDVFYLKILKFLDKFDYFLKKRIFLIQIFMEMEPNKKNRVTINKKNQINVINHLSKKDIRTIVILRDFIIKNFSLNENDEKKINLSKKLVYKFAKDASHHIGGTVFNKNKKKSFIDKNLKILGTKNTFICSSSVFPTAGSVNPTLLILALGLRLSKFLTKTLNNGK